MTAIYYDEVDDRIVIEGALQTYAPRTLMTVLDGDQVMVRLKVNARNEYGPTSYDQITQDVAGQVPAGTDAASTAAYLQGVFARRPPQRQTYGIAITAAGQVSIPMPSTPRLPTSLMLTVNGVDYRTPSIVLSGTVLLWTNPDFPLVPGDEVTLSYL